MSSKTTKYELFKYDKEADKNKTFNIDTGLNENWDKIDNALAEKLDSSSIPSQSGNTDKFLSTDGTSLIFKKVDSFPNMSGQTNKFLSTDGETVKWKDVLPPQAGKKGNYLATDGENLEWKQLSGLPIGTIYPLACSANYVPEGSLPCDGAEYTKAQFNDLWENYLTSEETETTYILNNCISVVGELTSQQGIYSGFADSKYLTVNIPEILAGESVIYTFKYNAGSDVTTNQDLFDTDIDSATKYLKLSNGKFVLSGAIQNTLDISPNSSFYIRLLISNTTLNIYVSKDGTNYYNLTAWNISNITSVNLGVLHNYGDPYTPFLGNIDLASSTLTYKSGDTVNLAEIKTVQKTLLNTCTYSEYASDISTYGQCGKFAVDFVNNKFKVPTIKDGYFVVVASGSVNESQMNWSEWASNAQNKLNKDHSNDEFPYIIEVSDKTLMPSWYRIYSDGWCEQGGLTSTIGKKGSSTISLLKQYTDTNYNVVYGELSGTNKDDNITIKNLTVDSFQIYVGDAGSNDGTWKTSALWRAAGYIN